MSTISPASDPDDVLEAVHAVMQVARLQQQRALRGGEHELTLLEGKVLGFFARHPGATQSELAAHSGRDKGQLARLILGLKDRGLLEARADDSDRRVMRLHLAAGAQAQHQALKRLRKRLAEVAVAGLSADEQRQLLALLERLRRNLEAWP